MTKILNLDKLAPAKRHIVFAGEKYEIEEMTVQNFLVTSAEAERLKDETSIPVQVEATVEMIKRSIPAIPVELLKKLPLEQLQLVSAFIRGDDVDGGSEGEEGK